MLNKVSSILVDGVALRFVNMSITASLIIIVVLLVRILLKKAPAVFSYALWGIVLFRLLCPISFSSPVSVFNLLNVPAVDNGRMAFVETGTVDGIRVGNAGQNQTGNVAPYFPGHVDLEEWDVTKDEKLKENASGDGAGIFADEIMKNEAPFDENDGSSVLLPDFGLYNQDKFFWLDFFCILWLTGSVVLLGVHTVRYLSLRKRVSASVRLRENIFLCDEIQTPFCLGVISPKIYLPSFLGKEEMEYIILHEKHHIRRLDHVVKLLAFLALCIHWMNPLVWVAYTLAGKDMEMSCDEAVVRKLGTDICARYSASLLHLATGRRFFTASVLSFGEGSPKQRIRNIMHYKKPVLGALIISLVVCIIAAVSLLSNPVSEEPADTVENENIQENIRQNIVGDGTSDDSGKTIFEPEKKADAEDEATPVEESRFHPEYERLLKLVGETIQNPLKAQQEMVTDPDLYVDDKGDQLFSTEFFIINDDSSQELGYLVQDINGDGIRELMLGVNFQHENTEAHIIFDLYTLKEDQLVHVLDGWWRKCYYLSDDGYLIMEGSSSASESDFAICEFDGEKLHVIQEGTGDSPKAYSTVCPYFIPFGAAYEELGDLDGNGQPEYVVYYGEDGIWDKFVTVFNLHKIYRHEDILFVDVWDARYLDLDHDGSKEVAMRMLPHVNSMPLVEYAVLKEKNGTWEKLEMYQGEDILDNTFPIHIVKGRELYDVKISVDGFEKELTIDIEDRYRYWEKASKEENPELGWTSPIFSSYQEVLAMKEGSPCAETAAWGIWEVEYGTFEERDCLIAEQAIQGYSKEDIWGELSIYFDYDLNGKIRILDLTFLPYEEE